MEKEENDQKERCRTYIYVGVVTAVLPRIYLRMICLRCIPGTSKLPSISCVRMPVVIQQYIFIFVFLLLVFGWLTGWLADCCCRRGDADAETRFLLRLDRQQLEVSPGTRFLTPNPLSVPAITAATQYVLTRAAVVWSH